MMKPRKIPKDLPCDVEMRRTVKDLLFALVYKNSKSPLNFRFWYSEELMELEAYIIKISDPEIAKYLIQKLHNLVEVHQQKGISQDANT